MDLEEINAEGYKVPKQIIMFIFMEGLPKEYEVICLAIRGSGKKSLEQDVVLSKLLQEEQKVQLSRTSSNRNSSQQDLNKNANRIFGRYLICWNCRENSYKQDNCPRKIGRAHV